MWMNNNQLASQQDLAVVIHYPYHSASSHNPLLTTTKHWYFLSIQYVIMMQNAKLRNTELEASAARHGPHSSIFGVSVNSNDIWNCALYSPAHGVPEDITGRRESLPYFIQRWPRMLCLFLYNELWEFHTRMFENHCPVPRSSPLGQWFQTFLSYETLKKWNSLYKIDKTVATLDEVGRGPRLLTVLSPSILRTLHEAKEVQNTIQMSLLLTVNSKMEE